VVQALVENGDATTPEVNPDEIIGALLLKDMKRGEVLAAASVKAAPLVLKDQFITIAFSHNGQVVETVARALEDGVKGQTIQVRNEATREIYKVTVTAEAAGTVNGSTGVAFTE
jgi:flagella basal body P-ring formation protein FlgA